MLRELRVTDLALFRELSLELGPGFSVFTGETGAGKSLLAGAIGLLLGERADGEQIRSGAEEATVSGVFELPAPRPALRQALADEGITLEQGALIVRRTIQRGGRTRAWVNQVPLTIAALKRIGDLLVDLHGQHDHQSLLREDSAREVLDHLAGVAPLSQRYAQAWNAWCAARDALEQHDRRCRELSERRDVIEFQYKELAALGLSAGEEARLQAELALLSSATQRLECAAGLTQALGGEEPLSGRLAAARKHLQALSRFDPTVSTWLADLESAATSLSELSSFAESYAAKAGSGSDPGRLDAVNERLARMQRLCKKYRCGSDDLLTRQDQLRADLAALENTEADRSQLASRAEAALAEAAAAGRALSQARCKHGHAFDALVARQMCSLGFPPEGWRTDFTPLPQPGPGGLEECRFMVRTNQGEPFLPLAKTASGGEISRLMLAVKTVIAEKDDVPILIFDEVDTGIGGTVANEVGSCLAGLSHSHQVLCISHLHQIASLADSHYQVHKQPQEGRTVTHVKRLSREEQVGELARMLGSDSDSARRHARELLRRD